jgi:hypothetical protein
MYLLENFFLKISVNIWIRIKLQILLISNLCGVFFFGMQGVKCMTIQIFYDLTPRKRRSWYLKQFDKNFSSYCLTLVSFLLKESVLISLHFNINHLTPNGHFSGRTAPLTYRCWCFLIYSTNIRTEYFKHAAHSPFFPLQNAVYFIMLPLLVPVLFTF